MALVRYTAEDLPEVSPEEIKRFDAIKETDIDFSDIPKLDGRSRLRPWRELHGKEAIAAREKLILEKTLSETH